MKCRIVDLNASMCEWYLSYYMFLTSNNDAIYVLRKSQRIICVRREKVCRIFMLVWLKVVSLSTVSPIYV